jgi:hypothetical protein
MPAAGGLRISKVAWSVLAPAMSSAWVFAMAEVFQWQFCPRSQEFMFNTHRVQADNRWSYLPRPRLGVLGSSALVCEEDGIMSVFVRAVPRSTSGALPVSRETGTDRLGRMGSHLDQTESLSLGPYRI